MVRCPVCEGTAVTVVLNSKPHATCTECGASWIQEGSWQRGIRPGQPSVAMLRQPLSSFETPVVPDDAVVVLPDAEARSRRQRPVPTPPTDEAVAT